MLLGIDFFLTHRIYVANGQKEDLLHRQRRPGVRPVRGGRWPAPGDAARSGRSGADRCATGGPDDATGYARRGTALASRQDFEGALADLTRACELAPGVGKYFVLRGEVQLRLDHPFAAMADFNEALRLNPDDVDARLDRARLHTPDTTPSRRARTWTPPTSSSRARPTSASTSGVCICAWTCWTRPCANSTCGLDAHDRDVNLKRVQNSRCWVRALLGKQLDQALDDCNAALTSEPESAEYLDSRGLVYLRTASSRRRCMTTTPPCVLNRSGPGPCTGAESLGCARVPPRPGTQTSLLRRPSFRRS